MTGIPCGAYSRRGGTDRHRKKILSDICKGNRNGDQEEPIAKAAQELQSSTNEAVYSSEWLNIDGLLQF